VNCGRWNDSLAGVSCGRRRRDLIIRRRRRHLIRTRNAGVRNHNPAVSIVRRDTLHHHVRLKAEADRHMRRVPRAPHRTARHRKVVMNSARKVRCHLARSVVHRIVRLAVRGSLVRQRVETVRNVRVAGHSDQRVRRRVAMVAMAAGTNRKGNPMVIVKAVTNGIFRARRRGEVDFLNAGLGADFCSFRASNALSFGGVRPTLWPDAICTT
jgi:hypothetical protein